METDPRAALAALIEARGEDYAGLSRLIGRNSAYIQQFIKRGTPRRLAEQDRRRLAAYFGVEESLLGGPEPLDTEESELVRVRRLDVGASAGAGALGAGERALGRIGFDKSWLRRLGADADHLSLIRVEGDSMAPTLTDGDEILVDRGDGADRLRDGIYVLRIDDALVVKRVALSPAGRRLSVLSDNPAYPSWPNCNPGAIDLVGRVVWVGRRLN
ncbi:MAG: helix-turn-helix transcriptional regulator [Allosphingosinicella sp.]